LVPLFGVALITCPADKAEEISRALLEKRVAACINILPRVSSLYWWENRVDVSEEALLLVKTRVDRFERLRRYVKELHPYDVPEIILLPIVTGYTEYLEWIAREVK